MVTLVLGCICSRKSKIGFLNSKYPKTDFAFLLILLNRSIQDLSDLDDLKSIFRVDFSVPLMHHYPRDLVLICSIKKLKIRFQNLSDLKITPIFTLSLFAHRHLKHDTSVREKQICNTNVQAKVKVCNITLLSYF